MSRKHTIRLLLVSLVIVLIIIILILRANTARTREAALDAIQEQLEQSP